MDSQKERIGSVAAHRVWVAVLAMTALVAAGCNKGDADNVVSGKVTLGGKPVEGEIVFVNADGKDFPSPIDGTDGSYSISNIPKGKMNVLVRSSTASLSSVGGSATVPQGAGAMPGMEGGGPTGVAPPRKYANPNKPLLTIEIEGGSQEKDWALKP